MRMRAKGQPERRAEAYLTIFAAMTIMALLTLCFVLLGGLRRSGARMRLESVTRIAADSVLAEFEPELHRQYDLFLIDTGYGAGEGGIGNVQGRLLYYLKENCRQRDRSFTGRKVEMTGLSIDSAQIGRARYACDNGERAVREQVYAYMTADPAGTLLGELLPEGESMKELENSGREWEAQMDQSEEELRQAFAEGRERVQEETPPAELPQENEEQVSEAEEMTETVSSFRCLPLLQQIFGDPSQIPSKAVGQEHLLSHRKIQTGEGLTIRNSHHYPCANSLVFTLYIGEKCRSFTGGASDKEEAGPLDCEQEYILCGKSSDAENLEHTARRLLLIREGANCVCLYADEERKGLVEAVAGAVSLLLLSPELKEPLTAGLLLGWAYVESLQDLRILLAGGRVPLRKKPSEWRTSLWNLLTPYKGVSVSGKERGLTYDQYLAGLLCLVGTSDRTRRTMDIMELNVRSASGNNAFKLDRCIDAFEMRVKGTGTGGYACEIQAEAGYN